METFPSTSQAEADYTDPTSEESKEKLFRYIERCNGEGVAIESILNFVNDGGINMLDFHELQTEKRIRTTVVRNQIVWVVAEHEATDRI